MHLAPTDIAAAIATLLIVLGFVCLLSQKIYLDKDTFKPIEIDVPVVGKMKANYPALVFVFCGFALAVYSLNQSASSTARWIISGVVTSATPVSDWQVTRAALDPRIEPYTLEADGTFKFSVDIPQGVTFEDYVQLFDLSNPQGHVQFVPSEIFKEYGKEDSNASSKLTAVAPNVRRYELKLEQVPGFASATN